MTELSFAARWRREIAKSGLPASARAVANALDLHMDKDGGSCWPSIATLAEETGLAQSTVRAAIRTLEEFGWIEVTLGGGVRGERYRTNRYTARMGRPYEPTESRGAQDVTPSGVVTSPPGNDTEPTDSRRQGRQEVVREVALASASPNAGEIEESETLLGAELPTAKAFQSVLAEVCDGDPETSSEWGRVRRAAKEIRAVPGITLDAIRSRAKRYREKYPNAELTPTALAANWSKLGSEAAGRDPYDECQECRASFGHHERDCSLEVDRRAEEAASWDRALAERARWFEAHGLEVPDDRDERAIRRRPSGASVFVERDALEELERHERRVQDESSKVLDDLANEAATEREEVDA